MRSSRSSAPVKKNVKKKNDYIVRLLTFQFFVCLLIYVLVFLSVRAGSGAFVQLRDEYKRLTKTDMSVGELIDALNGGLFMPAAENGAFNDNSNNDETPEADNEPENFGGVLEEFHGEETGAASSENLDFLDLRDGGEIKTSLLAYLSAEKLILPVSGRMSSGFGLRADPITGRQEFHSGVDIACQTGTSVTAAKSGTVESTGQDGARGKYVRIDCGNSIINCYYHCSKILVKKGDEVKSGDVIAKSGNTGRSTGPHLHFEIQINGESKNPLPLLEGLGGRG